MKKKIMSMILTTGILLGLTACSSYEPLVSRDGAATGSAVSGNSVTGVVSGGAVESDMIDTKEQKKNVLEDKEVIELIYVGEDQVALCQGDSADSVKIMLVHDEKESVLAEFAWKATECHIEPFEDILCHDGFRLYEQTEPPYGATVYYIGLEGERAKILSENNAIYNKEKKKYTADFDYIMDIDGDGDQEMISNNYYIRDGGAEAVLYDYQKGGVYAGSLEELFDLKEDEYYYTRAIDMRSEYDPKNGKVTVTYMSKEKPHKLKDKKYKIDLDKISMHKNSFFYKSDELKDIGNYYE